MGGLLLRWLLPEGHTASAIYLNTANAIYGLVLVGAVTAAESGRGESHLDVFVSVVLTIFVYWAAHAHSIALARRFLEGERLTLHALREGAIDGWPIVRGATVPMLALLIGWAAGASAQVALNVAVWSTVGALIALELLAGIRAKAGIVELLIDCCVGVAMGASVLALRALLH